MPALVPVPPPAEGVWRVGRNLPDASDRYEYRLPEPASVQYPLIGNRFDSFSGRYGVLYFGSSVEVCFAETLARFRPNPVLAEAVRDEWRQLGWMEPGNMPADWRARRLITGVHIDDSLPFLDIDHPDTIAALNDDQDLVAMLHTVCGVGEIDMGQITGPNRCVTRLISEHLWGMHDDDLVPFWAGIRYLSRLGAANGDSHYCWAVFEGTPLHEFQVRSIFPTDPDLQAVSARYHITVH